MRHDPRARGRATSLSAASAPPYVKVRVDAVAGDDRFVSTLDTQLEVIEPTAGLPGIPGGKGQVVLRAPMPVVAPGRYEAELRLPRTGAFLLRAIHRSKTGDQAR